MTEIVRTSDPQLPSEPSAGINFALVLSRTLDNVRENPAELRAVVYELARVKLKEQFGHEDAAEVKRLTRALEEAIEGVESFSQEETRRQLLLTSDRPPQPPDEHSVPEPALIAPHARTGAGEWPSKRQASAQVFPLGAFGTLGRLGLALTAVVMIVAAFVLWPQLRRLQNNPAIAERPATGSPATIRAMKTAAVPVKQEDVATASRPEPPPLPFPLPTRFGVYAISNDQLQELKALPGKVPDSRVAVSAAINAPSATALKENRPKFIVFRRDGAVSAPDRVELRLVARVTRAMGVDGDGKAKLTQEQDAWVIRNLAIPYGVGPVDEQHPDMYLIQPEAPDVDLPAGRYALVLKGQGFDFNIDGPVTDPRHCMERVDAVNGAFYSPCPQATKTR
jgi:hypothetical protein